jgi:hypothetical protein
MLFNFKVTVRWRTVDAEKWPILLRNLIENIGFTLDVNKLLVKLRHSRRLRGRGGRSGWCHARAEFVRESDSLGARLAFLRTGPGRRGGEGARYRTAALGSEVDLQEVPVMASR